MSIINDGHYFPRIRGIPIDGLNEPLTFARPYASYQRGTNENTNGLVRRQWPKGTAFGSLTEQDVSELELRLNMTPRKVLNGLTPIEAYTGRTLHLLC
ncbi:hypothetical protein KKJ30_19360 [Xenorhabdus bovienii]|nr:hypothetical protein [Xenorhabdus bovienii]MDE9483834.1 hypothetical protein [Xenorhabdus bovienii]